MMQAEDDFQDVLERLSVLEPTDGEKSAGSPHAWSLMERHIRSRQRDNLVARLGRLLAVSQRRVAYATALVVLLVGVAFSFPVVRAAASDFLGLFRVQKFAAVSVSPQQIALLERIAEEGLMPGEFIITEEPGAPAVVESVAEAGELAGATVRSVAALGEPGEIVVTADGNGEMIIDLEASRAILDAAGVDPALLPDSLDGERIQVEIAAGIEQRWDDGTVFVQMESPIVHYPADLQPAILGQALLQVLGVSEEEAARLAQSIDWTSTLLLPIPQGAARFEEVIVHGASSLALSSLDGAYGAVMWQEAGIIYLLSGQGDVGELVSLANSVR